MFVVHKIFVDLPVPQIPNEFGNVDSEPGDKSYENRTITRVDGGNHWHYTLLRKAERGTNQKINLIAYQEKYNFLK